MNKRDLIDRIVQRVDYPNYIVEDVVGALFDTISDELVNGGDVHIGDVHISNFGVLEPKVHKARKGTNPRTGVHIDIPEMKLVRFKTAQTLKDKLNK